MKRIWRYIKGLFRKERVVHLATGYCDWGMPTFGEYRIEMEDGCTVIIPFLECDDIDMQIEQLERLKETEKELRRNYVPFGTKKEINDPEQQLDE